MRKTSAVLLTLALALPLFAATEPNPSKKQRELIEEMMRVTKMEKLEADLFDTILAQMQEQLLEGASGDPAEQEEAKWKFERFRELLRKSDLHAATREMYIEIYAKYLSETELTDLVAFYRTPTGQKSLEIMPQLMADAMQRSGAILGPKIEEITQRVERESDQRQPWKKTIARIRNFAGYLEDHASENDGLYPAGDLAALVELFEDETLEKNDVWGHEIAYVVSHDRKHYRLVSAGADGIFDWDSRRIAENNGELRVRERLEDDIIYADGAFVQMPKVAAPKE